MSGSSSSFVHDCRFCSLDVNRAGCAGKEALDAAGHPAAAALLDDAYVQPQLGQDLVAALDMARLHRAVLLHACLGLQASFQAQQTPCPS